MTDGAGLVCVLFLLFIPLDIRFALLDTFRQTAGICRNIMSGTELIHIAFLNGIGHTEFNAVPAHVIRDVAHETLCGPVTFGNAVRTHGARVGSIGVNGPCLARDGIFARMIEPTERIDGIQNQGVAVVNISARIRPCFDGTSMQAHIVIHACFNVKTLGLTTTRGIKELFTAELKFYAPAAYLMAEPCIQRFVMHILLGAKSATDIRLDNTYVTPRDTKRLPNHTANDMRNLR